jgi:DNA-binding CsgD family transcriptional regulator
MITAERLDLAAVLVRLSALGPPSEVRAQAPHVAAEALRLDRVLLSSIGQGALVAEALHLGAGEDCAGVLAALREEPVPLDYPLIEGELMRRRRAQVVRVAGDGPAYAEELGWRTYLAAPIVLDGRVIGFFHADRHSGDLEDADAAGLASFAVCFGIVYERAALRRRLRDQREEMRQVAGWATARTSELGDRSVTLAEDADRPDPGSEVRTVGTGDNALRDLLTRREVEVLKLMVRGETNAGIARDLVVSEGTVKFHVKNILRKLHAANRAEAISRYLRLTLNQPHG